MSNGKLTREERDSIARLNEMATSYLHSTSGTAPLHNLEQEADRLGQALARRARPEITRKIENTIVDLLPRGTIFRLTAQSARLYHRCAQLSALLAWAGSKVSGTPPTPRRGPESPFRTLHRRCHAELAVLERRQPPPRLQLPEGTWRTAQHSLMRNCSALTLSFGLQPVLASEAVREELIESHQAFYGALAYAAQMLAHAQALRLDRIAIPSRPTPPGFGPAGVRAGLAEDRRNRGALVPRPPRVSGIGPRARQALGGSGTGDSQTRAAEAWITFALSGLRDVLHARGEQPSAAPLADVWPPDYAALLQPNGVLGDALKFELLSLYCFMLENSLYGFTALDERQRSPRTIRHPELVFLPLVRASSLAQQDFAATGIEASGRVTMGTYPSHGKNAFDVMVSANTRVTSVYPDLFYFGPEMLGSAPETPIGLYQHTGWMIPGSEVDHSSATQELADKISVGYFGRGFDALFAVQIQILRNRESAPSLTASQIAAIESIASLRMLQYFALAQGRLNHVFPSAEGAMARTSLLRVRRPQIMLFLAGLLFRANIDATALNHAIAAAQRDSLRTLTRESLLQGNPPDPFSRTEWENLLTNLLATGLTTATEQANWVRAGLGNQPWATTLTPAQRTAFTRAVETRMRQLLAPGSTAVGAANLQFAIAEYLQRSLIDPPRPALTPPPVADPDAPVRVSPNHLQGAAISIIHRYNRIDGPETAIAGRLFVKIGYRHMFSVLPASSRIPTDQWLHGRSTLGHSGSTGNADTPHIHLDIAIYYDVPRQGTRALGFLSPLLFLATPAAYTIDRSAPRLEPEPPESEFAELVDYEQRDREFLAEDERLSAQRSAQRRPRTPPSAARVTAVINRQIGVVTFGVPPQTQPVTGMSIVSVDGMPNTFGFGDRGSAEDWARQHRSTITAIVSTGTGGTTRYHIIDTGVTPPNPPVNLVVQSTLSVSGVAFVTWIRMPAPVAPTAPARIPRQVPPAQLSADARQFNTDFSWTFSAEQLRRLHTGLNTVLLNNSDLQDIVYRQWCGFRSRYLLLPGGGVSVVDSLPAGRDAETRGSSCRFKRSIFRDLLESRLASVFLHEMMHTREPIPRFTTFSAVQEGEGYGTQVFFADFAGDTPESERIASVIASFYGSTVSLQERPTADLRRDIIYLAWTLIMNAADQTRADFPYAPVNRRNVTAIAHMVITRSDWQSRPETSGLFSYLNDQTNRAQLFRQIHSRPPGFTPHYYRFYGTSAPIR